MKFSMNAEYFQRLALTILVVLAVGCKRSAAVADLPPALDPEQASAQAPVLHVEPDPEPEAEPEVEVEVEEAEEEISYSPILEQTLDGDGLCSDWEKVPLESHGEFSVQELRDDPDVWLDCIVAIHTRCIKDVTGDGQTDLLVRYTFINRMGDALGKSCDLFQESLVVDYPYDFFALTHLYAGGNREERLHSRVEYTIETGQTSSQTKLVAAPAVEDGRRGFLFDVRDFEPSMGLDCAWQSLAILDGKDIKTLFRSEASCEP